MKKREAPIVVRTFNEARIAYANEESIALDLETSGFSPWKNRIHVIALYGPVSNVISILHYPFGKAVPQKVLDWLSDFPEIVTHNGTMFDWLFLAQAGMNWEKPRKYDTMTGELSVQETDRRDYRVNLQDTIKRRLGKEIDKTIDHGRWGADELDENQLAYVTGDITHLIDMKQKQIFRAKERGTYECLVFEQSLTQTVIRMELQGLPVDVPEIAHYFERRHEAHAETVDYLTEKLGSINFGSYMQLGAALEIIHPGLFPDTKKETFQDVIRIGGDAAEISQKVLDWKNYRQRENMFSPKWVDEFVVLSPDNIYRVHGKFWQIGTNTGRFSSSQPNLQQVPRDMRSVYGNAEGYYILKSDYSAIEVRVAAVLAGDKAMIDAFNSGTDIHTYVASVAFNKSVEDVTKQERQIAKAMSFTLIFGGTVYTFMAYARNNGAIIDYPRAVKAVDTFYTLFPGILAEKVKAEERVAGFKATTLKYPTGLKRLVEGKDHKPTVLLNNRVQGVAASGIKFALKHMELEGISHYLAAVVHDEALMVVPQRDVEEIRVIMDQCMVRGMREALSKLNTPDISIGVESSYGMTWNTDKSTERKTESGV